MTTIKITTISLITAAIFAAIAFAAIEQAPPGPEPVPGLAAALAHAAQTPAPALFRPRPAGKPASVRSRAFRYRVRPGDSLSSISKAWLADEKLWPRLWWPNRHLVKNPAVIVPGQRLRLPGLRTVPAWLLRRAVAAEGPAPAVTSQPASSGGYTPPASGTVLSFGQIESVWTGAGGPAWAQSQAASIAECESGGNTRAWNPSGASGLWQILGQVVPGNIFDPHVNGLNAVAKFRASGNTFAQWVCQAAQTGAKTQASLLAKLLTGSGTARLYGNPLRSIRGLQGQRIDMGVDYGGTGWIHALGRGRIVNLYGGWPCGIFIVERLGAGRLRGRLAYFAEAIRPVVRIGQRVTKRTRIGWMWGAIETGWAAPLRYGHITMAALTGQWDGYDSTGYGMKFSWLLHHLGAPAGIRT